MPALRSLLLWVLQAPGPAPCWRCACAWPCALWAPAWPAPGLMRAARLRGAAQCSRLGACWPPTCVHWLVTARSRQQLCLTGCARVQRAPCSLHPRNPHGSGCCMCPAVPHGKGPNAGAGLVSLQAHQGAQVIARQAPGRGVRRLASRPPVLSSTRACTGELCGPCSAATASQFPALVTGEVRPAQAEQRACRVCATWRALCRHAPLSTAQCIKVAVVPWQACTGPAMH